MIPGEVFNYAAPRCAAHPLDDFGMPTQVLERGSDGINISRFHDDSLHTITYHIARLAGGDLRQTAGGRFIGNLGAAFPLRRKNMDRALAEIILECYRARIA